MRGLESFNIVLVGSNFPVQQVQVEDFDLHGRRPVVQFKVGQVLQAGVDEYVVQVLPDRFQIGATASKATGYRIEAIKSAALAFIDQYTSKRSITVVGHNFAGSFESSFVDADAFMQEIAWSDKLAAAIGGSNHPTLSLSTQVQLEGELAQTLRLEPFVKDRSRVFYDLNYSWGKPEEPIRTSVRAAIDRYSDSTKLGTELIERLASLGANLGGGKR